MSAIFQSVHPELATWEENGQLLQARWYPAVNGPLPKRIVTADDTLSADAAYRLISQGTGLLWRGDFQNARQLLQALTRRVDGRKQKSPKTAEPVASVNVFNRYRLQRSQRAHMLGKLLIPLEPDARIPLRRAPDVQNACMEALGALNEPFLLSLRGLQGIIGAHEWRKKGVAIPGLAESIHVHYGVFSPNRGEYIDLVAQAPLPCLRLAFDIGTGSGVLAALLVQRGVRNVVATDTDPRALACARENIERLGFADRIDIQNTHLFPEGRSPLIVCNPPWLPARPTTALEHAIYDPDSRMLLGFLDGLARHLTDDGEGWLIMSNLAELLGLRHAEFLPDAFATAGLRVIARTDIRPRHPKSFNAADPLYEARSQELTSLWRLSIAPASGGASGNQIPRA